MATVNDPHLKFKQMAADYAVNFVKSGMVVGLGHGSTAILAVRKIAHLIDAGEINNIIAIPCSKHIRQAAKDLNIPLSNLETHSRLNLTIDGADEVDPKLNLIKGGGGALLMEKKVALASDREIIIIDRSKYSDMLGTNWPLPIEVDVTKENDVLSALQKLGAHAAVRKTEKGKPFITDSSNHIIDANFGKLEDLELLSSQLAKIAGIVDHGLFLGIATDVIIAGVQGITHLRKDESN